MSISSRAPWPAATALFSAFAVSACMAAGTPPPSNAAPAERAPAQVGAPVGAGPFGQFIVKYRDSSAPLKQQGLVQARLNRTAGAVPGKALKLTWKHRMGINADVFAVEPALDAEGARRLMQAFAADPDVQFIEPDNHIALDPIIRGPAIQGPDVRNPEVIEKSDK
ncbi:hypothetical protein K4L06_11740 [Lysobacter sp. BMK333-48F3]|uniref:hypothetical protein n=1 Tax=Lysobacter sp. BMK333-48F3 TaxID=2867962 RepID=UPI001C8CDD60|nr:hypothetical protein [Lysobacter sp. BMK333-48F3]MBX9401982.1 hypothetical protein [Lysobacter sp. BMK333-48F3]